MEQRIRITSYNVCYTKLLRIGKAICDAFIKEGVNVCTIDLQDNDYFVGDIADENILKQFAEKVIAEHGTIDYFINNACLSKGA